MGAVFALYSGWYFWIPKILGLDYNLVYSKAHFWVLFAGVNLTFFPQHFLGLQGMPRRISDYPDAFTGWNFISSIGSMISVAATALFLHIVNLQLVKGKAIFGYAWAVPQLFTDYLRILINKNAPGLEWALNNPPKAHAFTSLPLQSTVRDQVGIYEGEPHMVPSQEEFRSEANDNPETVKANGDRMLEETDQERDRIKGNIRSEENAGNISREEANALNTRVDNTHGQVHSTVKETVNVAIDGIDDSEATSHLVYNGPEFFFPIIIYDLPVIRVLFIAYAITRLPYYPLVKSILVCNLKNYAITLSVILISSLIIYCCYYCNVINCDAPRAWGLYFQDSASPQMEALVELHNNIMYYLVAILFAVGWIQAAIIRNFDSSKSPISNKYLNHGTLIELIWTITPALILVLIAFPSFKLLYLMDEVTDPSLSVLAEGHQWYWSYEYPDFLNSDGDFIEFDSYLVPESDLEDGALRMLEVDNRVILPEITHTRFILTAADVIHSFAIPALGVKCDAYPGRLNQFSVLINRLGTFYGQCSEICGILHSSMPIVVESVSIEKFLSWLREQ